MSGASTATYAATPPTLAKSLNPLPILTHNILRTLKAKARISRCSEPILGGKSGGRVTLQVQPRSRSRSRSNRPICQAADCRQPCIRISALYAKNSTGLPIPSLRHDSSFSPLRVPNEAMSWAMIASSRSLFVDAALASVLVVD